MNFPTVSESFFQSPKSSSSGTIARSSFENVFKKFTKQNNQPPKKQSSLPSSSQPPPESIENRSKSTTTAKQYQTCWASVVVGLRSNSNNNNKMMTVTTSTPLAIKSLISATLVTNLLQTVLGMKSLLPDVARFDGRWSSSGQLHSSSSSSSSLFSSILHSWTTNTAFCQYSPSSMMKNSGCGGFYKKLKQTDHNRSCLHHHNNHRHYRDRCRHPTLLLLLPQGFNLSFSWLLMRIVLLILALNIRSNECALNHHVVVDEGHDVINSNYQHHPMISVPSNDIDGNSIENFIENSQHSNLEPYTKSESIHSTSSHVFPEFICKSINIKNSVALFKELENCTVIEGHLQIVLFDYGTPKDFENLTFPKLREITDYFLLFRIIGLQSLAKMFPNLSVIRGQHLMHNYAFVIYEMLHLQEIGLKSLTNIVRGDVRIEKNPNLCFVDTIDWSRIARNYMISDNKDPEMCPSCDESCPIVSARKDNGKSVGDIYNRVCWTPKVCQKHSCSLKCEQQNQTCNDAGECCPECLGGCSANKTCFACKNFVYNNTCYDVCPFNTYDYKDRWCLTKEQCHAMDLPSSNLYYKAIVTKDYKRECNYVCPTGYAENPSNPSECYFCGTDCPKVCSSTQVTNIATAQSLKGCTIINGSLDIIISNEGALIVKELEESLQDLVEITWFLKIARSFPLISLNFLKNLRTIRGEKLERNFFSLLIVDNPNLQDLWTNKESNQTQFSKGLQILNGRMFIHMNPKLCYAKIEQMTNYTHIPNQKSVWDDRDISPHSNGDKVPCNVHKLNVNVWGITSNVVGIDFENFKSKMEDPRSLLGYLINYRESEHKNVTIFDGRDACSNNEWTVVEYDASDSDYKVNFQVDTDSEDSVVAVNKTQSLRHILPNLKPFTQYALYIKTYTINTATKGAQSDIIYFKTLSDTPSRPRNLFAKAIQHNEISANWDAPFKPNGEVTHYMVQATKDYLPIVYRDYCNENIIKDNQVTKPVVVKEASSSISHWLTTPSSLNSSELNSPKNETQLQKQCCSCRTNEKIRPTFVEQSINFEDYLINTVYVKRDFLKSEDKSSRRKRQTNDDFENNLDYDGEESLFNITTTTTTTEATESIKSNIWRKKWQFNKVVFAKNILIEDLHHFTEYTIEIKACQTPENNETSSTKHCSVTAITSVRTLPLEGADDIETESFFFEFDNTTKIQKFKPVHVKWKEPVNPNGYILYYQVEYRRITDENPKTKTSSLCITRQQYESHNMGYLLELAPGNYSIRIRSRSLANFGNWTNFIHVFIDEPANNFILIVIIIFLAFIFILFSIVLIIYFKIKLNRSKLDYLSVNPEYISVVLGEYKSDPEWEIAREDIKLIRELGEGSFGKVYEGEFIKNKLTTNCAVKTLNENANARDHKNFLKEADIMKSFTDCHHVVKLLGICSKTSPFFVLMEIMPYGDLKNYLRANRPDNEENSNSQPPSLSQIYKMAIEIADGMAYLSSKKFVHRDLAARNCMLAADLTCKIGDFGMTRDICESDYYRKGDKGFLPVRWMSPESLKDGIFTTFSDVWAYGIVLWEMITMASQPYQGLSNEEVLKFLIDGNHMLKPENCPETLWKLMMACWNRKPKARPVFMKIIEMLLDYIEDMPKFLNVSYYNKSKNKQETYSNYDHQKSITKDESSIPLNQFNFDSKNESDDEENRDELFDDDDMDVQFFPCRMLSTVFTRSNNNENNTEDDLDESDSSSEKTLEGDRNSNISASNNNNQFDSFLNRHHRTPSTATSISSNSSNEKNLQTNFNNNESPKRHHPNDDLLSFSSLIHPNHPNDKSVLNHNLTKSNRNIINGHLMNTSIV